MSNLQHVTQSQVFAVIKVSYILTSCPMSRILDLTFLLQVVLSAILS